MPQAIVVTHVSHSSLTGTVQPFEQDRVRIGRRPDNDVAFDPHEDRTASGHHCEVYREDDRLFVQDLESANGTWVNGQKITGRLELRPGDRIRVGEEGPEMRVALVKTDQPPPPPPAKRGIGQNTMIQAINTATGAERSKMNRRLLVVLVLLLAAGAVAVWYTKDRERRMDERRASEQRRFETQLAELRKLREAESKRAEAAMEKLLGQHTKELDALKTKLSSGEREVANLIVRIQERDGALKALRDRQDLSEKERKALMKMTEAQVEELNQKLRKAETDLRSKKGSEAPDWAAVAKRNEVGVFLIVAQWPKTATEGARQTIGTAFCLRKDGLLGTNAHVVKSIESAPVKAAVQNVTGRIFNIKRVHAHPGWGKTVNGPDVGLIEIDAGGDELPALELASTGDVRKLRIGMQLGTIGFPGELGAHYLSKIDREKKIVLTAVATFKDGWIGRITDYEGASANSKNAKYIQHSASLTGGTSGSPMFTVDGKVVAVNHAGTEYTITVKGAGKSEAATTRAPSAAEIGYAIRIDELRDLWKAAGW